MYQSSRIVIPAFVLAFGLAFWGGVALAQEEILSAEGEPPVEEPTERSGLSYPDISLPANTPVLQDGNSAAVIVADVGLVDLDINVEDARIFGSFSVISRLGRQHDIVLGVVFVNDKGQLLGGMNIGELDSLDEGEIRREKIDLEVPSLSVASPVTVRLVAETKRGLPLSSKTIGEVSFSAGVDLSSTCAVESTAPDKIKCSVDPNFEGEIVFKSSLISNEEMARVKISKSNEAVIEIALPNSVSGNYYGILYNQNQESISVFRGISSREYAEFRNVLVYDEGQSLVIVAPLISKLSTKPVLSYQLTGVDGEVCSQAKVDVLTTVFATAIEKRPSCETGQITIELFDQEGKVLAAHSSSYNVQGHAQINTQPKIEDQQEQKRNFSVTFVLVATGFLVAALIILVRWYLRKQADEKPINNTNV